MGFKKAILVLLLLIILTMGAASAADTNTTSDNLAATEETSLKLSENDNFEEKLGIDESTTPLSGPGNSSGKFADLNTLISGATAGDTVTLTVDYCKESDFYDLISIDKELTIDGQGHIIDANNTRDIMRIDNAQNVKLKNIQFINVKGNSSTALYWAYGSDNGLIENCTFTNCLGIDGSAINLIGSNTNIIGSTFINCSGYEGGAIYWGGNDNSIRYSYFENTTANKGGAIYLYGERGRIEGTTFKNCNMPNSTVIYADNIVNIIGCEFTTTRNETLSSLVYNGNLTNCTLNGISDKYADLNMRIDSNIIGTCKIGDTIELTATVYNNGPDDAKNVSAHFAIPPSLEIIGNTPYAGSFDSMTGIWNIPEIFSTSWATLTITCQAIKAENTTVNAFVSSDAKDLNLTDNNASANLFILRADTTLTLNVSDIFAGETLRIFVDITPIDATGNLTINIGGVEEQSFINGSDVIMKEGLSAGEYNITVTYSGNANYLPAQSNLSFRVNKRNVNLTISLDENTITYGQNATLTAIMPIDGNIAININNETYNITTIAGTGHLLIPTQPAGNHTITATFEGNDQYNPANTTIMLTINKTDPPITINTTDIKYGQNATITVTTLPDATGNLSISIDSKIYGMATIISGTAAFNIPGLTVGNHTVTATYSGDENYNPANKSATQTVNKADVDLGISLYPNATEFKRGDTVEFIINLINNGPNDATNITVNLTLPNSLRYKSSNTSTAYEDSQTFIWIIDRLNANNTASITFYCDVMGAGMIELNSTASTENEIDTDNTSNAATLLINASESKVVTPDKFDCFFDENGTLLNVSTDELTFEGDFSNITASIIINKAITFIGNNATFKDVSFIVKSDHVGIVNFTIISENATGCAINASSHSNILLSNNTIIYKAMFDSDAYVLYANI